MSLRNCRARRDLPTALHALKIQHRRQALLRAQVARVIPDRLVSMVERALCVNQEHTRMGRRVQLVLQESTARLDRQKSQTVPQDLPQVLAAKAAQAANATLATPERTESRAKFVQKALGRALQGTRSALHAQREQRQNKEAPDCFRASAIVDTQDQREVHAQPARRAHTSR